MSNQSHQRQFEQFYDSEAAPERHGGGKDVNGYFLPRHYPLMLSSLKRATRNWIGRLILDAGCGSGHTGRFLLNDNRVIGLDISEKMLQLAHRSYERVLQAEVEHLPFADRSFDSVLAGGVWQCLPTNTTFLAEVERVLRPGGEVVFGSLNNSQHLIFRPPYFVDSDKQISVQTYAWQEVEQMLLNAGLEIINWYNIVLPFGVLTTTRPNRWLAPLVIGFTLLCRKASAS